MVNVGFAEGYIVSNHVFSWVFLVDWIMAIILTVFMLFFFNRLAGFLISSAFRWVLWHKWKIEVKVQALQLSLLGGRLFFKNASYIGSNEAITAIQGNVTWRYWLPRIRMPEILRARSSESDDSTKTEDVPIRLKVQLSGLEWFVFNRSPAYDGMLDGFNKHHQGTSSGKEHRNSTTYSSVSSSTEADITAHKETDSSRARPADKSTARALADGLSTFINGDILAQRYPFLKVLPIEIECYKGAMVCGNKTTSSVLVLHFASGSSIVDAAPAKSALDHYKMKFTFNLKQAMVELRPNMDFSEQSSTGGLFEQGDRELVPDRSDSRLSIKSILLFPLHLIILPLKFLAKVDLSDVDRDDFGAPSNPNWRGLQRYHMHGSDDTSLNIPLEGSGFEEQYAKFSNIIEAPDAEMVYYYDVAGKVPSKPLPTHTRDGPEIGNSGSCPEWGMDVILHNSTIYYGPWADRERLSIMKMLVPRSCYDSVAEPRKQIGEERLATMFKLFIELQGDTLMRIPTREVSKNAFFAAELRDNPILSSRPCGWIELKTIETSTFSFNQAMVAGQVGWQSDYVLDLKNPELRSSVNHGLLFSASSHVTTGSIKIPHQWNGQQTWNINNISKNVKVFLLREHITLLSDLLSDFASGPPAPYDLFTPAVYEVSWDFLDYGLFLNVNDKNVINNPSDFDDNVYLSFQGSLLALKITIPMVEIAPIKDHFEFTLTTPQFNLVIDAPPWHTMHNFSKGGGRNEVGRSYGFDLKGSYTFYSIPNPAVADTLVIYCNSGPTTLIAHGYVIKYLMKIRENYFGEFIHFRTLEEFNSHPIDRVTGYTHNRTGAAMDVLLHVFVHSGTLVLPANLYDVESYLRLDFAFFDTDCRFTNYYMDLQMNIAPLKGRIEPCGNRDLVLDLAKTHLKGEPEVFIDGIVIHGNRLFGLPPTEPTYFCKWDFDVGDVLINGPMSLGNELGRIVECLAFTFNDFENSLIPDDPPLYDVTFLSLKLSSVNLKLNGVIDPTCDGLKDEALSGLEVMTSSIDLTFNDLANERYSAKARLAIPLFRLAVVSGDHTLSSFETSLLWTNFTQKAEYQQHRQLQQDHIMLHDSEFKRCPFLLDEHHRYSPEYTYVKLNPHLPIPINPVAPPLTRDTVGIVDPNMANMHQEEDDEYSSRASARSGVFVLDPHDGGMTRGRTGKGRRVSSAFESAADYGGFSRSPSSSRERHKKEELDQKAPQKSVTYEADPKAVQESYFLPPNSGKRRSYKNISTNFDLKPTSYYSNDEQLAPKSILDKTANYNNQIIQLGPVEGYISPPIFNAVNDLIEAMELGDVAVILDLLQIKFLDQFKLRHLAYISPEVENYRLILPSVNIKYGELQESMSGSTLNCSHIYAELKNISLVMRLARTKKLSLDQIIKGEELTAEKTIYFNMDSLFVGVRKSTSTPSTPMLFQIDHGEFWWHEDRESSGSLKLRALDFFVMSDQIVWLTEFLAHNILEVKRLHKSRLERAAMKTAAAKKSYGRHDKVVLLLYELVKASETYSITHDPSVLTRPAYIIQSSHHIRATTSWKILMRLRHILQSAPDEWRAKVEKELKDSTFKVPEEAISAITSSFSNWRSWELSDVANSFLFRYVFQEHSLREHILSITTHTSVDIESIGLRMQYPDEEEFICFDYLKIMLNWMNGPVNLNRVNLLSSEKASTLEVDLRVTCSNIRSRLTYRLIEVMISMGEMQRSSFKEPVQPDDSKIDLFEPQSQNAQEFPMVTLSSSLNIDSTALQFALPSLEVVCEGSRVKASLFCEQLDDNDMLTMLMSIVTVTEHFKMDLMQRHKRDSLGAPVETPSNSPIISTIFRDARLSAGFDGDMRDVEKHINVSCSHTSTEVGYSVEMLAKLGVTLLDLDYVFIRGMLDRLRPSGNHEENIIATTDTVLHDAALTSMVEQIYRVTGPFNLRFHAHHSELYFSLFPQFGLVYSLADGLVQAVLSSGMSLRNMLSARRMDLALVGDERHKRLVQLMLKNFEWVVICQHIVQAQTKVLPIFDTFLNLDSIELDSASISFVISQILDLLKSPAIKGAERAVEELEKSLSDPTSDRVAEMEDKTNKTEKAYYLFHRLSEMTYKARVVIRRLAFYILIEDSTAVIGIEGLVLDSGTYYPVIEGDGRFLIPMNFSLRWDEFFLNIESPEISRDLSSIVKFQFYMSYDDPVGKKKLRVGSRSARVILAAVTTENVVRLAKGLGGEVDRITRFSKERTSSTESSVDLSNADAPNNQAGRNNQSGFGSSFDMFKIKEWIHETNMSVNLQDAAVIWLFGKEIPQRGFLGFQVGYDEVEVSTDSGNLAVAVRGIYSTPADDGDIYMSKGFDSLRSNSIFMPSVEIVSRLSSDEKKNPVMMIQIKGNGIQMTFLPTISAIITDLYLSLNQTATVIGELLKELEDSGSKQQDDTRPVQSIRLPFSFRVSLELAAAQVDLWDEIEFNAWSVGEAQDKRRSAVFVESYLDESTKDQKQNVPQYTVAELPAVSLETPTLTGFLSYTRSLNVQDEPDTFHGDINITPNSNTIWPKVVPVACRAYEIFKKGIIRNNKLLAKPIVIDTDRHQFTAEDVDKLFADVDFKVGIRWFRQELTFSCMPTAKVQASVSLDHSYIGLDTANEEVKSSDPKKIIGRLTNIVTKVEGLKASFQHVYSRDISGYAVVKEIFVLGTRLKHLHNSSYQSPLNFGGKISDIMFDINLKQMQELELFHDIWFSQDSIYADTADRIQTQSAGQSSRGIVAKYRRASTTSALPWSIDLSITNVAGKVDMGQSVGKIVTGLDRFWLSMYKLSNWEQNLSFGFDKISLTSEGRLGASLLLENLHAQVGIIWQVAADTDAGTEVSEELYLPLVQVVSGVDLFESKVTLDYHTFFIGVIKKLHLGMSNNRDEVGTMSDQLLVVGKCDMIDVFLTDLAASFFLDILYTFKRLRTDSHASYNAILKEVTQPLSPDRRMSDKDKSGRHDDVLASILTKLRVVLDVSLNQFNFYIFPNSFTDKDVFTLSLRDAETRFEQETAGSLLDSKLDMTMSSFEVRLATIKKPIGADIGHLPPLRFVMHALANARGGVIILIPVFNISMETWQQESSTKIEYTFRSLFGGKVDVGWNLGSINFIRDMWATHARAYAARRATYHIENDSKVLSAEKIDDRLRDVELSTKYSYFARERPIISTPQLREMGEATPPIEWIGLHRTKFPGMTHQIIIRGLQRMVQEVENIYEEVLGRS